MKNSKNVLNYIYGVGAISELKNLLSNKRDGSVIFFLDEFFKKSYISNNLPIYENDNLYIVETKEEPSTDYIDSITENLKQFLNYKNLKPSAVVGIGGGITLDTAKAVSNLLTNNGRAEEYQGWDLVKNPGIYKIGIPTISGTGAEASRTCVMLNIKKNLKLGMNSEFTIYDQLIQDPNLTITVPKNQYFYTGMDTYIHCIESLRGSFRHPIGDAFSHQALSLCKEVFNSEDMQNDEGRGKLMVASYLGGCAIANSFVGIVHPFSAGLSVVLHTHHCISNCIIMNNMEEFYPEETHEFQKMVDKQKVNIPSGICKNLTDDQYERLYLSTIVHENPLKNALGENFKNILTKEKVIEIFKKL